MARLNELDDDVIVTPDKMQSGGATGALSRLIGRADDKMQQRITMSDRGLSLDAQRKQIPRDAAKPFAGGTPKLSVLGQAGSRSQRDITESNIGKQGKVVLDADGKPRWEGLQGGWLRNEATGETYAVGSDKGNAMRKVGADREVVPNFQENKLSRFGIGLDQATTESPYEITDSTLTGEELDRFNRPVGRVGTRKVSRGHPDFTGPDAGMTKYSPDYGRSSTPPQDMMPRFTAPGFTGTARAARIATQEQRWRENQRKNAQQTKLATFGQQGAMRQEAMAGEIASRKEAGIDRRFGATQAFARTKDALDREDALKKKPKKNWKFIPDIDPLSGKELSTGRFYDASADELKQIQGTSQGSEQNLNQNSATSFLSNYK